MGIECVHSLIFTFKNWAIVEHNVFQIFRSSTVTEAITFRSAIHIHVLVVPIVKILHVRVRVSSIVIATAGWWTRQSADLGVICH